MFSFVPASHTALLCRSRLSSCNRTPRPLAAGTLYRIVTHNPRCLAPSSAQLSLHPHTAVSRLRKTVPAVRIAFPCFPRHIFKLGLAQRVSQVSAERARPLLFTYVSGTSRSEPQNLSSCPDTWCSTQHVHQLQTGTCVAFLFVSPQRLTDFVSSVELCSLGHKLLLASALDGCSTAAWNSNSLHYLGLVARSSGARISTLYMLHNNLLFAFPSRNFASSHQTLLNTTNSVLFRYKNHLF